MWNGYVIPLWMVALTGVLFACYIKILVSWSKGIWAAGLTILVIPLLWYFAGTVIWGDIRRSALFTIFMLGPSYIGYFKGPFKKIAARTAEYLILCSAYTWMLWIVSWGNVDAAMDLLVYADELANMEAFLKPSLYALLSMMHASALMFVPRHFLISAVMAVLVAVVYMPRIKARVQYWTE